MSTTVNIYRCGKCGQLHYFDEPGEVGDWHCHLRRPFEHYGGFRLAKDESGKLDIVEVPEVSHYVARRHVKCWRCGAHISKKNFAGYAGCYRWSSRTNALQIPCHYCGQIHFQLYSDWAAGRAHQCPWCYAYLKSRDWMDVYIQPFKGNTYKV